MTNNLTKPDKRKNLSTEKRLYLLNLDNGRVFPWTALLAVRKGMIDCTQDGHPINPKDVPGNHPWIKQQTGGLRDRMVDAGANVDTLQDFGRQLTSDAEAKFKSLEYENAKVMLPGKEKKLVKVSEAGWVGMSIRVQNKIDKRVNQVKDEIFVMAVDALKSLGFSEYEARMRLND